jgi:hypothetical protein
VFDGKAGPPVAGFAPADLLGNARVIDQSTGGFGTNEGGDRFASALAAGDFNGDGMVDLAVGAPGEGPADDPAGSGIVFVFRGDATGLQPDRGLEQEQILDGLGGNAQTFQNEANDNFGSALAVGDFNGDGMKDLAVGAPGQVSNRRQQAGMAFVFRGSMQGLQSGQGLAQGLFQDISIIVVRDVPVPVPVPAPANAGDRFGFSLMAGDFDGDRRDDLAIGAPGIAQLFNGAAGKVFLFKGSEQLTPDRILTQESENLDRSGSGDEFGLAMTAADQDKDGRMDLIIGAPGKASMRNARQRSGAVFLFGGTQVGLRGERRLQDQGPFPPLGSMPAGNPPGGSPGNPPGGSPGNPPGGGTPPGGTPPLSRG